MTDEEARIEASKERAAEEDRKRRDKALSRFRFSEEARRKVKEAYMEMIDRQLDAVEENFPAIFSSFSTDELDGMSGEDASGFVRMVVDGIASVLAGSGHKVEAEIARLVSDKDAMDSLSKAFRESSGLSPQEKKD